MRVYDLLAKYSHSACRMGHNRTPTTITEPQVASIEEKAQINYATRKQGSKLRMRGIL